MKKAFTKQNGIFILLYFLAANSFLLVSKNMLFLIPVILLAIVVNLGVGIAKDETKKIRILVCRHGAGALTVFGGVFFPSIIYHIILLFFISHWSVLFSLIFMTGAQTILFINGIISVYCASVQLGIKWRVLGIFCAAIPVINLMILTIIIATVLDEVEFEIMKEKELSENKDKKLCKTKYPILLVHGVFFRDYKYLNYWGRIPDTLKENGATVYYAKHQSALPVRKSAIEIAERVRYIVQMHDCEKVNIIAHSKGGLDVRCAIAEREIAPFVASVTTISTPHRGCIFAEYLLKKISSKVKDTIAGTYNKTLKQLGDTDPDLIAAVSDLTPSACEKFNEEWTFPDEIYHKSIGSVVSGVIGGRFPFNLSYKLVDYFDGHNDGLVSESSFRWDEEPLVLYPKGRRGISHGDIVDMNRDNIPHFDVRKFYVDLVSDLRERGL